jgi:hypothetical protein
MSKSLDYSEDRISCDGPDERLRLWFGILDIAIDFLDQILHAAKTSRGEWLVG